LLFYLKTL